MLLGVAAVILGGFIIICGAPFTNSCLYKAGGGLFLTAGELSTSTYVLIFMIYHGINISVLKKTKKNLRFFLIFLGFFALLATVLFVIWLELMNVVDLYKEYRRSHCFIFQLDITYGLSFMFAPVGVFFCFLSGMLFLLIGRALKQHNC